MSYLIITLVADTVPEPDLLSFSQFGQFLPTAYGSFPPSYDSNQLWGVKASAC